MNIAVVAEALGIKARGEDGLVAPVAHTAPQRHADLMPCVGQHLGFAL